MAKEIERKYLVTNEDFKKQATQVYHIEQAYLSVQPTIRLRIRDKEAFITIKGASSNNGLSRDEWEYSIPLAEAQEMMSLAKGRKIIKKRYLVPDDDLTWEVDVFEGDYAGLIIAELELDSERTTCTHFPQWVGEEVTGQSKYYNASMALRPEL